jgi:hypothetical protein
VGDSVGNSELLVGVFSGVAVATGEVVGSAVSWVVGLGLVVGDGLLLIRVKLAEALPLVVSSVAVIVYTAAPTDGNRKE